MAISGTEALGAAVTKGTDSASSKTQLFGNMETFLYLLVNQLQNQDPLDPMDTAEYTNQLVQYANVEQSIQTNSYLETMISQNVASVGAQAVGYMDQVVQIESTTLPLSDGYAKFSYTLGENATNVTISLLDSSNTVVKTFSEGNREAGRYVLDWDGTDSSGQAYADGAYKIVVSAKSASGGDVSVYTTVFGKVTGVAFDGDEVAISVGGAVIAKMENILAVHTKDELEKPKDPEEPEEPEKPEEPDAPQEPDAPEEPDNSGDADNDADNGTETGTQSFIKRNIKRALKQAA